MRLERLFPNAYDPDDLFREGNELGPPVPREVFDLNTHYQLSDGEALEAAFLQTISPASNRFLRPPAAMLADGFEGAPYGRAV